MTQYVIVYFGGNPPATAEEGQRHFARYVEWLKSLGDAAVSPANPLMHTRTVGADGTVSEGGASAMSGYTIVEADSIDAAIVMAQNCPFLEIGGTLEVSERVDMPLDL